MRRIFIMIIAVAAISGAVFGRGTGDDFGQGAGNGQNLGAGTDGESVILSGVIEERDDHIVLLTDKGMFSLSAPGFYRSGEEIPLGEKVQVSGILNTADCGECDIDTDGHVFVTSALVDGRELSFDTGRGGAGRMGGGRNSATGNRWSDDDFGNRNGNRGGGRGGNGSRDGSGPRYGQSTGA